MPMLDLDWEVGIFRALSSLWRFLRPEAKPLWDATRACHLQDHQGVLTVLAQIIAGEPLRVLPALHAGGVRGRDILLPPVLDLGPSINDNRSIYVLRTLHSAMLYRLGPSQPVPCDPAKRLSHTLHQVAKAAEWASAEFTHFGPAWAGACALARQQRPPIETFRGKALLLERARIDLLEGGHPWENHALWEQWAHAPEGGPPSPDVPLWGEFILALQEGNLHGKGDESRPPDGREQAAPPVEELQRVLIDPKEQEQKVLQHTFEKVETAENFDGAVRDDDGADELEDHADALKELELKQLIRGGQQAHSIYKADIRIDADIPDVGTISPDEQGIPYDEWNGAAKAWKRQWCTVYPSMVPQQDPAWVAAALLRHHALIQRLRRQLESHRSGRLMAYRQLEGEEVDLDAVVQHQASVAAGHSGAARLYQRTERHRRDFATLVLMDVSLSADAWVANRRVLDVARESVLVLGEVAALLGDNLTVQAFASNTRNCCRVWHVHGPQENWKQSRGRLGVLEPQGYTRMGPALRHATATLAAQSVSRKLLILISDGKPNDYDRYEGRYGVSDVRMALHEAQQQGIHTHALAIDAVARDYLPTMLGPGAWSVLLSPNQLPERLSSVYGRLTA